MIVAALATAGCRCPADRQPSKPPAAPARPPIAATKTGDLEVGIGKTAFEPLADGASLERVAEPFPLGCCHLWLSLKATDMGSAPVPVRAGFYRPSDGAELWVNSYQTPFSPDAGQVLGLFAVLPGTKDDELELRVDVIDPKARVRTDTRRIHLLPPKGSP